MKIPRWAQVLIGIAIVMVFLGIGAIIAISAYFSQHLVVNSSTSSQADDEFERVRKQFNGKPPILEMKNGVPHYVDGRVKLLPDQQRPLETLHVLAWDANDEKLVNVAVPWWILRLKSGPIQFSSYAGGWDDARVRLTTQEIEQYGPGIIMEAEGRRGERVLLWAE
jgi:hypothetical protein